MARVEVPVKDKLLDWLARLDSRVSAIERRPGLRPDSQVLVPIHHEQGGGFPGDWNTVYFPGGVANDHAYSHITQVRHSRLAYHFDLRAGDATKPAYARVVAVNTDNPYGASLPAWQVLDERNELSTSFQTKLGNIELPAEMTDSEDTAWNIAIFGRVPTGDGNPAGNQFWQVRTWSFVLTDDSDFVPERGFVI